MTSGISLAEQETAINFYRTDDRMSIYTSDQTMITKLCILVEKTKQNEESAYQLMREEKIDGRVVAIEVTAPKKFLSFKTMTRKMDLTDEERRALAERLRKARNHGNE